MRSPATRGSLSRREGYSLLEILMVMALIMLMAGMLVGVSSYAKRRASVARARAEIQVLRNALEEYRRVNHMFLIPPPAASNFVVNRMTDDVFTNLFEFADSGIATNIFVDPWGLAYRYRYIGPNEFEIWSEGQDTTDPDDDIQ